MAAIVDRFQKSAFGGAAGQPLGPELPHRQIAHIGVDLDAQDQAALEAEFLCDGVVVDLVFRGGGQIESVDFVYQCGGGGHVFSSRQSFEFDMGCFAEIPIVREIKWCPQRESNSHSLTGTGF